MANNRKYYTVDYEKEIIKVVIERLTEKQIKEVKNFKDLGFKIIPVEPPKKKKPTEEEKIKNPFSEKNIKKFLEDKGTKDQLKKYFEIYNQQAIDKETGFPAVYKSNSKPNSPKKFKIGDPKPKGHIATLQWFKTEFPNYPEVS